MTPHEILLSILEKPYIHPGEDRTYFAALARLSVTFPAYRNESLPKDFDYNRVLTELHHLRFENLLKERLAESFTIEASLRRKIPAPNSKACGAILSSAYLVKQNHHFRCQVCEGLWPLPKAGDIQVHHIQPLSDGGEDLSYNQF